MFIGMLGDQDSSERRYPLKFPLIYSVFKIPYFYSVFSSQTPDSWPFWAPFWPWNPEMLENIGESGMQKWHWPKNPGKYSEKSPKTSKNAGKQQGHSKHMGHGCSLSFFFSLSDSLSLTSLSLTSLTSLSLTSLSLTSLPLTSLSLTSVSLTSLPLTSLSLTSLSLTSLSLIDLAVSFGCFSLTAPSLNFPLSNLSFSNFSFSNFSFSN